MEKIKEPEYKKRIPDKETKSMRMWISDEKKYPNEWKEANEFDKGIEILYKSMKFNICGFNQAIDPKTKELKFAWKIKPEERLILIYNPSNDDIESIFKNLNDIGLGFEIQDVMDVIINAYNELPKEDRTKLGEINGTENTN
jgi:hypothetical protein